VSRVNLLLIYSVLIFAITGTSLGLTLRDSKGLVAQSAPFTILAGSMHHPIVAHLTIYLLSHS
jgi:hypothetical protein